MAYQSPPQKQFADPSILMSHFIRQIESQHIRTLSQEPLMLHFDPRTGGLAEYAWPVDPVTEERIQPNQLEAHRRTHEFCTPCCFCAFLECKTYTEAEIAIVEVGSKDAEGNSALLNGEYVAICAKRRCGFFLYLERFYPLPNLMEEAHELREKPLALDRLAYVSDIGKSYRRGDGLFQIMPDVVARNRTNRLQSVHPDDIKAVKAKLVADLMAGVSEGAFWNIFVQCVECRQVQFREHYANNHRCSHTSPSHAIDSPRQHPYRRSPQRRTHRKADFHAHMAAMIGDTPCNRPMGGLSIRRRIADDAVSDGDFSDSYALTEVSTQYNDSPTTDGIARETSLSDGTPPSLLQLISEARRANVKSNSVIRGSGEESPHATLHDRASQSSGSQHSQNATEDPFWTDNSDASMAGVHSPDQGGKDSESGSNDNSTSLHASESGGDDEENGAASPVADDGGVSEYDEETSAATSSDDMDPPAARTSDMEKWTSPYDTVYDAISRINGPQ